MDLRTFLKPAELPTGSPPQLGAPAPPLPGADVTDRARLVVFLRHVGCPVAEAVLRDLDEIARRAPDVRCVAVSHGTEDATLAWHRAIVPDSPVVFVVDPSRELYAAWGLGLTGLGHFAGPRTLLEVGRLYRAGIRNRHPSGSRWQRSGAFAVDAAGTLRWRHLPARGTDRPCLAEALRAVAAPAVTPRRGASAGRGGSGRGGD